jgi:hypothetical protein
MNLTKETAVTGVRKNKDGKIVAFNINRKNWGRGFRGGSLLNVDKVKKQINMCCLGVFARACGVSTKRLIDVDMPDELNGRIPKDLGQFINSSGKDSTYLALKLAEYNDNKESGDARKEAQIIKGFAEIGVKVRFVGKG